jgi:hypothetical protein
LNLVTILLTCSSKKAPGNGGCISI